ncbi:ammonium transporter [Desulfomonile tiedjei]|uniref:Ammonium transporter n=1 Tax=Desulfomonile tiedjei (strain ATCC 49306 / DSM 6799 / DCB-1) TaxID=706587 RepID=I4CCD1_DESTA|nr:ammonium transporter [Desulfomonile tiedjei]AFM27222.1 ammonium transporter [Desulfomonile tiedjei DSM 6799]
MNTGDNAWVLASAALVFLMTPAVALFYGGMTRTKNVLATIMQSFIVMGLVSVVWMLWGFSLAFGPDVFHGFLGGTKYFGLNHIAGELWTGSTIAAATFVVFQCGFAVITPALITGAFAERMNFGPFLIFIALWSTFVYCPLAHWVWGPDGWLSNMGALDFAGGTVVHISAGMAGLACALSLGKRDGYGEKPIMPHNLTLTLVGAGLLWIGWYGFNSGSALKANESAAMAFLVTQIAASAAVLSWVCSEWIVQGRPTTLGMASGAVGGLVAITPAAGYVGPVSALVLGLVAGALCFFACYSKKFLGYDDSLDVFGIHAVGGAWGAIATGIFAAKEIGGVDGLVYGNVGQFTTQIIAVVGTSIYAFSATFILMFVLNLFLYMRVPRDQEEEGLDTAIHGEAGYNF